MMLSDLSHIPRIMRREKWLNAAVPLERWFSRPATAYPSYTDPDITTIRMDAWALTFPRAREVYENLVKERIWSNPSARAAIAIMLRRKWLLGSMLRVFGSLSAPVRLQNPDYINQRPAGGYSTFDDLTAALGSFNFRVVVAGTVRPMTFAADGLQRLPGIGVEYQVEIEEIGVYVRDSFDFDGDQYLGCWSEKPDGFSPLMPPMMEGSFRPPIFTPVGNRDFREWRKTKGQGGDFLVFSDVKRVKLNPPDRFVISAA